MIELHDNALVLSFPEVHPAARLTVSFQRTLRIPDDDDAYPLPPGLGRFPLRHVDDPITSIPRSWLRHGGVMLPIHQAEALWVHFKSDWMKDYQTPYPFAVKVACGKINAVTGDLWSTVPHRRPDQDYLVVPEQPWLDGYCVAKGIIRQFVAMPLGAGYTAEEQVTGGTDTGGLQLQVMPMRREVFEKRFPMKYRYQVSKRHYLYVTESPAQYNMGLAPGGRMRQEIAQDPYRLSDWERKQRGRCFVHLANAEQWRRITGEQPPETPVTAQVYTDAGLPWFSWYDERLVPIQGSRRLSQLKSVAAIKRQKHRGLPPGNRPVDVKTVISLSPRGETEEADGTKANQSREVEHVT